jgi:uncharacterized membrane protein YfcA
MENQSKLRSKLWYLIPSILLLGLFLTIVLKYNEVFTVEKIQNGFNRDFVIYLCIGIFAQLVDSTLGMGYGATCTSFLLTFGVNPATSSMAVHVSEIFTTGASAMSHYKFKNIDEQLVFRLIVPGVLGAVTGAYLLSDVIDGKKIKPYVAAYMIVLAIIIILKSIRKNIAPKETKHVGLLAVFGGFMDSVGGGGWGPIVASTLIGRGDNPRYTIGSVNTAEFAIAFSSGITFILFEGISGWRVIAGLILGGIIAAPVGAYLVNKIPRKFMTIFVGCLLILLSLRTLWAIFV